MEKFSNILPKGSILTSKTYSYCIEKVLGQGSFGITYLASVKMQGALGILDVKVKVAIKEFFMKDINGREGTTVTSGSKGGLFADYRKKFVREALNLSKLQHPHIIKVLECFEANGTVYYAMEYLEGGCLDALIEKKKGLSEAETIGYARQIASALSYMHEHKMLHLDLKPGNIMLHEGNAVLIDFGLSKQYDSSGNPESSTTVGGGTPGYAPIEQANYHEGKGFPVTMDIYALGATMYKMLTGVRAPDASEILNEGFPREMFAKVNCSDQIIDLIAKAMSPMKKGRFGSVDDMLHSLCSAKSSEKTKVDPLHGTINDISDSSDRTVIDNSVVIPDRIMHDDTPEVIPDSIVPKIPSFKMPGRILAYLFFGLIGLFILASLLWDSDHASDSYDKGYVFEDTVLCEEEPVAYDSVWVDSVAM